MISIDPDVIKELADKGLRIDRRAFDEYRPIKIETGVIEKAEGSAKVELGGTKVIAGVKMEVGEPFPDSPDEGVLITNAEFLAFAHQEFEEGPPNEDSIELARVVDRAIRESKAINFKKLCIEEGKKVWMIFIDIDILDHDGNLIDAASLAAIAALLNAKFPKLEIVEEGDEKKYTIDYEQKTDPLPIEQRPITITAAKINGKILLDPNIAEESAVEGEVSMGVTDNMIASIQKSSPGGFTIEEINRIAEISLKKAAEIRGLLK
ncbi:MAG: exosome complex protein Rrp42 [Candidatus Aenigmarchaeota archaeon]|nr:exosome complex protein Rrp42 [Candidatus Aenigmarchaeota archaeon]